MHADLPASLEWFTPCECFFAYMLAFTLTFSYLIQKAALNMQEQECLANEKVEKDLKAALKAKREPTALRVASPSVGEGNSAKDSPKEPLLEQKLPFVKPNNVEDVNMEHETPQGSWLPELTAIFDNVKKIAWSRIQRHRVCLDRCFLS